MRQMLKLFFCTCMLILPLSSYAWNALGHMVIANIAYQQLKPEVKAKVNNLVNYFNNEYPDIDSFVKLAPWPDAIRSQKIDTYTHWHYIDNPLSVDGTEAPVTIIDTDNAVWALKNIQKVVANNAANNYERARFLAFLIHIVGDQHQPLHTVSYVSEKYPTGDRGGNSYTVYYPTGKTNLHAVWDKGVNLFTGESTQAAVTSLSNKITNQYPKTYFGDAVNNLDFDAWSQEGVVNAKSYVYTTPENKVLSNAYVTAGADFAAQEAALAGYRLGNLLNQLLA